MNWILTTPVVALTILQGPAAAQPLNPRTEADAYIVYASALGLQPPVILMRETEGPSPTYGCSSRVISELSGEWQKVARDFRDKNARTWLLQPGVLGFEYRLMSKAEISADDARLAKQYAGRPPMPIPGSIPYVAVSAVGFNATRTKALVYVRRRNGDGLLQLIRIGNRWVRDPNGHKCISQS
jgi:hypothetical protein